MPSSTSVPPRFADKTLGTFDPARSKSSQKGFDAANEVVDGRLANLVLVGPTGAGKTHLAAGIVNEVRRRADAAHLVSVAVRADDEPYPRLPAKPMWANVADLIVAMRSEMDRPPDDRYATDTARRLRLHPTLIVLDDLGREKTSDWTGEVIYALVNSRYENRMPTIVTSNLTASELGSSPYWPVISRLAEDGRLIDLGGTSDYRLNS